MAERRAEVRWEGGLADGKGTITTTGSGVLDGQEVSWPRRVESEQGKTSPEELIAAAHASCFSMALSNTIGQGGSKPERLQTSATVSFEQIPGGYGITKIALDVVGTVPGMDAAAFEEAARQAKDNCPVSKALAGGPAISVTARLEP
jgi:osmotically inducible protein OsmC